jgi:hypothetical protein
MDWLNAALRASQAVYVKLLLVQVKAGRQASQKFDPAFGPKSDEARKCGQLTAWFRRHSGFVRSAAFSPDGQRGALEAAGASRLDRGRWSSAVF